MINITAAKQVSLLCKSIWELGISAEEIPEINVQPTQHNLTPLALRNKVSQGSLLT
jgi:hypothetical protein